MEYISINKMNQVIKENLYKIPNDVDLIVAIPRSGLLPATFISLLKNIPMCDLDSLLKDRLYSSGNTKNKNHFINSVSEAKHILLVDDSSYSGTALINAKNNLPQNIISKCTTLVIFANENTKNICDIYFEKINGSRIFEWNLFHHSYLKYGGLDLGTIYKNNNFIIIPTQKINTIIIPNNESKNNIKSILKLNNISYEKVVYENEIENSIYFIITNNANKFISLNIDIIDVNNNMIYKKTNNSK